MSGYEALLGIFVIFAVLLFILVVIDIRKPKKYRKHVMDMYVASKTRQLALRDKLDLDKEEVFFKDWLKKYKRSQKDDVELDDEIEEDLKEKISEESKSKK